jgi:hypothetical protein
MTPAMLALITAVGPPDWATMQFPTKSAIRLFLCLIRPRLVQSATSLQTTRAKSIPDAKNAHSAAGAFFRRRRLMPAERNTNHEQDIALDRPAPRRHRFQPG